MNRSGKAPRRAIFTDANPHIIEFYNQLTSGNSTPYVVQAFLEHEGQVLAQGDETYCYTAYTYFNNEHNTSDFFNHACFTGIIRSIKYYDVNIFMGIICEKLYNNT